MLPTLAALLGLPAQPPPRQQARLSAPLPKNGPREHYMRAQVDGPDIQAFDRQDSALLSVLSKSNALLIRPPGAGPCKPGDLVDYIKL